MGKKNRLAKLSTPVHSRIIPRPQLYAQLDPSREHRLVWITAPPGAGKTSLVAGWLRSCGMRHIWDHLDHGDGDIATFFRYFSLAAETLVARQEVPEFSSEHLAAPLAFARQFFRALGEALPLPATIVLDDYHDVGQSLLDEVLRVAVPELPAGAVMVVLSRHSPPATLAALEAKGLMLVIDAQQLRLSLEETSSLAQTWGYAGDVRAVHEYTEGWAAGAVLLIGRSKAGELPQGKDRLLFDYFAAEVLAGLDSTDQKVLLETSLVPQVTSGMAGEITGVPQAQDILSRLADRGYFVVRLDTPSPSYQFHSLFQKFLARRAQESLPPERCAEIRIKAGHLYEQREQIDLAFDLFLDGGSVEDAARIAIVRAPQLLRQGRAHTVAEWIGRLPGALVTSEPWLLLWRGQASFEAGRADLEQALALFERRSDAAGAYLSWAGIVEWYFLSLNDLAPLDSWISKLAVLREKFPQYPGTETEAYVVAAAFTAISNRQPSHRDLSEWEDRAYSLVLSLSDPHLRLLLGRTLLLHYGWWAMDLHRARVLVEKLRSLATVRWAEPAMAIFWHIADACHHLYSGHLKECSDTAGQGIDTAVESGFRLWDAPLLMMRCWTEFAEGNREAVDRTLAEMAEGRSLLLQCLYHQGASIVNRQRGDRASALEHAKLSLELARAGGMPFAEASCGVALGMAQADLGHTEHNLTQAVEFSRRCKNRLFHAAGLLALAVRAIHCGDIGRASEYLREGLALGQEIGCLHFLWFTLEELADCCAVALRYEIESDYVRKLIRTRGLRPGQLGATIEGWPGRSQVYVLNGRTTVHHDGLRVTGRREQQKCLELLRRLALSKDGVSQEVLADALWDSDCKEGDSALHTLEVTASRLRKLLGDSSAVVCHGGYYRLDQTKVYIDAWEVTSLLEEIGSLPRGDQSLDCPEPRRGQIAHRLNQLWPNVREVPQGGDLSRLAARVQRALGGNS